MLAVRQRAVNHSPTVVNAPYWETKSLAEMTQEEWESLCDGCALCCLHKLEDEDSAEVWFSDVACRLLDTESCRCRNYKDRQREVPDCIVLAADAPERFAWLPASCAYRRLYEGKPLPEWHPLLTGDTESVHRAGISVRGKVRTEGDGVSISVLMRLDDDMS